MLDCYPLASTEDSVSFEPFPFAPAAPEPPDALRVCTLLEATGAARFFLAFFAAPEPAAAVSSARGTAARFVAADFFFGPLAGDASPTFSGCVLDFSDRSG